MRPVYRSRVNKRRSVNRFKRNVRQTKMANIKGLARGGIRL